MSNKLTKADAKRIRQEYLRLKRDEEVLHNTILHQQILETWRRDSPMMYRELNVLGILEAMAYVSQERMWLEQERLVEAGMPITDAQELAEREHLMLEPEEEPQEAEPDNWVRSLAQDDP